MIVTPQKTQNIFVTELVKSYPGTDLRKTSPVY